MKIVVNRCYGGFGLSVPAVRRYLELCGKELHVYKSDNTAYGMVKCEDGESSAFLCHYYTKDLGEKINDKDYRKYYFSAYGIDRDDPNLIQTIEELGSEVCSGQCSELEIVEVPDDVSWEIDDYDGIETIHETHRSW